MAANRKVTVQVNLQGGGNLSQTAQQAAAQVAKLQSTVKGVPAGVPVAQFAPGAAQATTAPMIPQAGLLATKLAAASQSQVLAAETKLAYLRTGPGQRATIAATRAEADLAKQQTYLAQVAARGRAGAAVDRFASAVQPGLAMARNIGAMGLAASYGGIASVSPEASSQITNSFRMIANEIGIATIPAATRFTGVLQSVSRAIRTANEATHGWAGNVAFGGAMVLTSAGILSMGINAVQRGVQGLQWAGIIGQGAATAAGSAGGGAVSAGAGAAGGLGAGGLTAGLAGMALNPAVLVTGGAITAGTAYHFEGQRREREAAGGSRSMLSHAGDVLSWLSVPLMLGRGASWLTGGSAAGGPADVSERNPRMYADSVAMQEALSMRAEAQPGPLAEQEARAMQEFVTALTSATPALAAIGVQANFTPQAGENG